MIRLHETALINVKTGEDDCEVESSIGVRQGSCEGLILFLSIMQAAMDTLTWPGAQPFSAPAQKVSPWVSIDPESAMHPFDLWTSLFADDCAIFFNSRADLELGASYFFKHLRRFGLMMHIDVDTTLSKTEAMYFPPPRVDYSNADTSRFDIRNTDGSTVGFVESSKEFKYLGSILDSSLTSNADVDKRIKTATSAFGALKNVLINLSVDLRVKVGSTSLRS